MTLVSKRWCEVPAPVNVLYDDEQYEYFPLEIDYRTVGKGQTLRKELGSFM